MPHEINPFNRGVDYGFSVNLFGGKLIIRATQHKTEQLGTCTSTLIATVRRLDIWDGTTSRPFGLNLRARDWIRNANPGFTEAQLDQAVADTMKMSVDQVKALEDTTLQLADWNDVTSKGKEVEIAYNPTHYWTVKLNLAEQKTINTAPSDSLTRWVDERMPVWEDIIDADTNQPWFTSPYQSGSSVTAQSYLDGNFTSQFKVARARIGKSLPQVRKYRVNLLTNFRLSGVTDHRILRRFIMGGALRWRDKGAIGYYGVQQLPDVILDLDPSRPIWDKARLEADAFIAYRTRLLSDKIGATFQLNVRNIQESGRLEPITAFPDGTPYGLRIIDPRQFILTVTFDL